jgi:hypothetical protein
VKLCPEMQDEQNVPFMVNSRSIQYSKEDSICATHMLNSIHQCGKVNKIWKVCTLQRSVNEYERTFLYLWIQNA